MRWSIFHLRFTTPLRAGRLVGASGLEAAAPLLHSDTLFSALCNTWARYGIVPDAELSSLGDALSGGARPFAVSSAFPYVKAVGYTHYVPTPASAAAALEGSLPASRRALARKTFKAAPLVPIGIARKWNDVRMTLMDEDLKAPNGWRAFVREVWEGHHARDRLTDAAALYHVAGYRFGGRAVEAGLWGLIGVAEGDTGSRWGERVEEGLQFLGGDGVGGRRSRWGRFEPTVGAAPTGTALSRWLGEHSGQRPGLLLSTCLPTPEEADRIDDARREHAATPPPVRFPGQRNEPTAAAADSLSVAYRLLRRDGWTFSERSPVQAKRRAVTSLAEGSVLPASLNIGGHVPDVRHPSAALPHPAWRYGLAVTLPL